MQTDSTFTVLKQTDSRSPRYQAYRAEWDRRGAALDPGVAPIHVDLELVATCDLRCQFCNIWTHEHVRTQGFRGSRAYPAGFMDPQLFNNLSVDAATFGVKSIKLNYRGEPTLHPEIVRFVSALSDQPFVDIMINSNGNGGARKDPDIFAKLVEAGVVNLMFSVDACDPGTYAEQRKGGDWDLLNRSVKSAVEAKRNAKSRDCRIRASIVRTVLNSDDIDSNRLQDYWLAIGVDWVSVSECYYPGGKRHKWAVSNWRPMDVDEFQCADPFRRLVITWDGKSALPCCQAVEKECDAGSAHEKSLLELWHSPKFAHLRNRHISRTWDQIGMCWRCPLTHQPL